MPGCEWGGLAGKLTNSHRDLWGQKMGGKQNHSAGLKEGFWISILPHVSGCWQTTLRQEEESLCCVFLKVISNESKRAENGQQITFNPLFPSGWQCWDLAGRTVWVQSSISGSGHSKPALLDTPAFPSRGGACHSIWGNCTYSSHPILSPPHRRFFTLFFLIKSMSSFFLISLSKK